MKETKQLKPPQKLKWWPTYKRKVVKTPPNHNSLIDYCLQRISGRLQSKPQEHRAKITADKQMESLVFLAPRHHHSTPLLEKLHWLPISERISIKSLVCVSVLSMVLVLLTSLNCCMSTLCLVHYALLLTPACWKSNNTNARLIAFAPSLALNPTFGIHSHKTLDIAQPCHLLKPNWKPFSSPVFPF